MLLPAVLTSLAMVGRRDFVRGTVAAGAAALSTGACLPASASVTTELREGEEALKGAKTSQEVTEALTRLLEISDQYEGLPSTALKDELVSVMRAKRSALSGNKNGWDGISEEAYNRLMRSADPWRVSELQPVASTSMLTFIPAYIALLVAQQLVPKAFPVAYAGMAALVLGPLVLQIVVG